MGMPGGLQGWEIMMVKLWAAAWDVTNTLTASYRQLVSDQTSAGSLSCSILLPDRRVGFCP